MLQTLLIRVHSLAFNSVGETLVIAVLKRLCMFWPVAVLGFVVSSALQAKQITIWHQKEKATTFIQEILKPLEQQFGAEFSIHYIATNDLKAALITSAVNGKPPDLVLIPSDFFGDYRNFSLMAVPEKLKSSLSIDEDAWRQSKIDNNYFGVPLYIGNHMLLYYNKTIIEEPAHSWQQLVAQTSSLSPAQQLIGLNYKELFWFVHLASAFDAYPVTEGRLSLNTEEFTHALTFYRNLSRSGMISPNCDYSCSSKRFIGGEFAYALNGDWAYREIKQAMGEELGIAPLPRIKGTRIKSYFSTLNLAFPGYTEQAVLSPLEMAIIDRFFDQQNQIIMFEQLGLLPTTQRTRALLNVSEDYKQVLDTLGQAIPLPSSRAMTAAWAGMRKGLDYFLAHDISPQRASEIMQTVAERELLRLEEER